MVDNKIKSAPPTYLLDGRIKWVDTAKALGVFLVFWGHLLYDGSSVGGVINRAIYSFHMPMFFILSGFVAKQTSIPLKEFIKNKFRRILLPAILLYLLTMPLYFLTLNYSTASLKSIIIQIFYLYGSCAYNRPIWFFICMFQVLVVARMINLTALNNRWLVVVIFLSLLFSYYSYSSGIKYFSILGFDKTLLALFFYSVGVFLKRLEYVNYIKVIGLISIPIWLVPGLIINDKVGMYGMHLDNYWCFIVSSIAGSLVFFALCTLLDKFGRLRKYANWTIFIIGTHYLLVRGFRSLAIISSFEETITYDVLSLCFVIIMMAVYKPVCEFIDKSVPVLNGK